MKAAEFGFIAGLAVVALVDQPHAVNALVITLGVLLVTSLGKNSPRKNKPIVFEKLPSTTKGNAHG